MNSLSSASYTHTTRESPGDRENGRLTLEVWDLEYNLIWVGPITSFTILEQNPSLKDSKLKKPQILEMVEDVLNKGFHGDSMVSLKITTTETQQMTLKCEQKTPYIAFSLSLILASYKNFSGIIDDVRSAFKDRFEGVNKRLDDIVEELGKVQEGRQTLNVEQQETQEQPVSLGMRMDALAANVESVGASVEVLVSKLQALDMKVEDTTEKYFKLADGMDKSVDKRFEDILNVVEAVNVRLGKVEAIFTKLAADSSSIKV